MYLNNKIEKIAKPSSFSLKENVIFELIQKYGIEKQVGQTIEEMAELTVELNKNVNRNKDNRNKILEEYIDVRFMLDQIKMIYNFTDEEIKFMDEKKITKAATNI